ncbi:MAG: CHAT domain-containing protein [Cyanobacteria bacterium P01_C01_bin.89]
MSITVLECALQVITRDSYPEQWAAIQHYLANAYRDRVRGVPEDNIEHAITTYKKALEVRTRTAHPQQWAGTQNNLAHAYRKRIQGKKSENIELAINACNCALEVFTRDTFPEEWATVRDTLGITFCSRIRGRTAENIELAVEAHKDALSVFTHGNAPERWAAVQQNLAVAYRNRISGDPAENIEQAITASKQALEIRTCDAYPELWAMIHNNLGVAYRIRIRGYRENNVKQAIACGKCALEVHIRDDWPEQWAMAQHNLGIAYCFLEEERASNIEQGIAAFEAALEVRTLDTFPELWAMTQQCLANAYRERKRGVSEDNLEKALTACESALKVYTRDAFPEKWAGTQNNLANIYRDRIKGKPKDNAQKAIIAYRSSLEVHNYASLPELHRMISRNLGDLQVRLGDWRSAAHAYENSLLAAEKIYQTCLMLDGKAGELRENGDLLRRTAYAYGRTGKWQQTATVIEQWRARGLSDSLQRDRANLTQLQESNPELRNRYGEVTNQLRNLEAIQRTDQLMGDRNAITPEARRNEAQRLNRELTETLEQIRKVPDHEKFLQPPTFDDLKPSFRADNPLVYLITTPQGSLALIALPDRIDHLWLDDFTAETLNEYLKTWLDAYNNRQDDRHRWFSTLETITGQLWQPVMEPVVTYLDNHNLKRATLIPTGLLSLFPLHAAWTPDQTTPTGKRYALDHICFTYSPNGQSLTAARAIAQNHPTVDTLLALENPTNDLPNTHREIETATKAFTNVKVLPKEQATVEAVKTALTQTAIAHFACHGTADLNEPLQSGLKMSDGLLTLNDLFALKLTGGDRTGIRLAILSACETGLPGLELADEAIGLPTGLLQAGVAGVVASLWAIDDRSTALLVEAFYHFWRTENLDPPEALRQAQQYLRDSTAAELNAGIQTNRDGRGDRKVLAVGGKKLSERLQYEHPFYWAGFSYFGI